MKLTQEQKRVLLAEAAGWTFIESLALTGIPKGSRGNADARVIPDYFGSLDAVRSLMVSLTQEQLERFADNLCDRVAGGDPDPDIIALIVSTPEEQCESLGVSLGLWKEGE